MTEPTAENPFVGVNYNMIQFVQLSRIYDVLMALLQHENPKAAEMLLAAHADGKLVSPSPDYTGEFVFDEMNNSLPEQ